ncbi:MAG: type II toxin-antitoxin system VapC family toxin [Candidatus Hydrogenedentota bacterium]
MRNLRIYLDTSVISHLFHDDSPTLQEATQELFENAIATNIHDSFISGVVLDELRRAKDPVLRAKFLEVVSRYPLGILPSDDPEVARIARLYMDGGVLPSKKPEDAFHVAFATVFEMDVLVTWNFRHLAKAKTSAMVAGINRMEGYSKPLQLLTPLEVLEP